VLGDFRDCWLQGKAAAPTARKLAMVENLESVIARREAPRRVIARKEKPGTKAAPEPIQNSQQTANKSLYENLLYEGRALDIFSIESVAQQPRRRKLH
jgi:hypothetical protein